MPISPEQSLVKERPDEFKVPENLKSEIQAIETNTKANVQMDGQGQPVVSSQAPTGAKIQIPSDLTTLIAQAKGSVVNAITWLAKFFLRMIAKQKYANSND